MKLKMDFVDQVFHFKGLWGIPSLCGIKIHKTPEQHLVIATDLFDQNPGTSVTEFCAQLASLACQEFDLDPQKLLFIEHSPETGSKLEIYDEQFHRVTFAPVEEGFGTPDWNPLTRAEVESMLN